MNEKKYKVYIYISPSNKVYIGQTCKNNLDQRAGYNGQCYIHCTHFYAAIQKYGIKNFKRYILKDNLTLEEANYWEKYYIKLYDSTNKEKGYNITEGGDSHIISEEARQKKSQKMKENNPMKNPEIAAKVAEKNRGKKVSKEGRINISEGHKKKILCIETNIIYNSREDAAKAMNVSPSGIGRAATGEQKTSAGYHWRYVDDN